jgi:3-oxoadipate enol-lactonase
MMGFFDADGTVLHVARAGQGRPLVFVNSLGSDFRIWDDVLPALTPRAEVIRYDKRGHGLSDLGPISMEGHVADLAALLDGLATGPAVVCGLSVGGQIALGLSAARPDLIRGLILMDTGHRIGTPAMWDDRIATVTAAGIAGIAENILTRWFTPAFPRDPPGRSGRRAQHADPDAGGGLSGHLGGDPRCRFHGCRAGAAGSHPLHGGRSGRLHPARTGRRNGRADPRRPVRDRRGCGPSACIEQPGVTAALIGGFLDALEAAP